MGENSEILQAIWHYKQSLEKYCKKRNEEKLLYYIKKLNKMPITVKHLIDTGIGRTVNSVRKLNGNVAKAADRLIVKWKLLVSENKQETEEEEEDSEDSESHENITQQHVHSSHNSDTDNDNCNERDSDSQSDADEKPEYNSKQDKNEYNDYENGKKSRKSHDSSIKGNKEEKESRRSEIGESSKSSKSKDERHSHHHHDGSSKSSKSSRRSDHKSEMSQSRNKQSIHVEEKQSSKHSKSGVDKKEKHKSGHRHEKHSKSSRNNSENETDNSGSENDRKKHTKQIIKEEKNSDCEEEKEKHRKRKKHKESSRHSSQKNEKATPEKHKKKHEDDEPKKSSKKSRTDGETEEKSRPSDKISKMSKSLAKGKSVTPKCANGIDSGSGASFAEALGMLEPTSSKTYVKKKSAAPLPVHSNNSSPMEADSPPESPSMVPKILKSSTEPLDLGISSLLPEITPNYRPLGNSLLENAYHRNKIITDDQALAAVLTSRTQRTKVYSGNKTWSTVPSLEELCVRVIKDNIYAMEYTGGVPYSILKPVLEHLNAPQLFQLEHFNPYLIDDTDELWHYHCQKEFKTKEQVDMETWRETYLRCIDERDAKLKALTANIKQSQDKSLPVRQTKLAYVDSVAKPPRQIIKKQARHGTAGSVEKRPMITPSSRLNALATEGAATVVPNPGPKAASSSAVAVKPKKAPLMQKTLAFFKNNRRFRR